MQNPVCVQNYDYDGVDSQSSKSSSIQNASNYSEWKVKEQRKRSPVPLI